LVEQQAIRLGIEVEIGELQQAQGRWISPPWA